MWIILLLRYWRYYKEWKWEKNVKCFKKLLESYCELSELENKVYYFEQDYCEQIREWILIAIFGHITQLLNQNIFYSLPRLHYLNINYAEHIVMWWTFHADQAVWKKKDMAYWGSNCFVIINSFGKKKRQKTFEKAEKHSHSHKLRPSSIKMQLSTIYSLNLWTLLWLVWI